MGKRVYIETTIVSYLVSLPSRDLVIAGRQEMTREWWNERRGEFELYVSELVAREAGAGDAAASERRLALLQEAAFLDIGEEVAVLARALIEEGPLPQKAADDAIHLATAAVHGMDFLLTWNCAHLANAEMADEISDLLVRKGYRPPVICTPETLMGERS